MQDDTITKVLKRHEDTITRDLAFSIIGTLENFSVTTNEDAAFSCFQTETHVVFRAVQGAHRSQHTITHEQIRAMSSFTSLPRLLTCIKKQWREAVPEPSLASVRLLNSVVDKCQSLPTVDYDEESVKIVADNISHAVPIAQWLRMSIPFYQRCAESRYNSRLDSKHKLIAKDKDQPKSVSFDAIPQIIEPRQRDFDPDLEPPTKSQKTT